VTCLTCNRALQLFTQVVEDVCMPADDRHHGVPLYASEAPKLCVKPLLFPFPRTVKHLTVLVQLCPFHNKQ
jgi:hypothetical protein